MPSLQELSSQSLVSSLGLTDIIRQREQEARQLGEITMLKGQAEAEKIASKGRGRRGVFETLGTIIGTAGGAVLGGPAGAAIGSKVGGGLAGTIAGGESPRGIGAADVIQQGVGLGAGLIGQKRAAQQQQEIFQQQQAAKEQQQAFENALDVRKLELQESQLGREELDRELEKVATITKQEDVIRKEYNPIKKQFDTISAANQKIEAAIKRGTAAGDVAAIFSFMKVLDPGSVVREGEQATASNAAGIPDRTRNLYNRALEGVKLGDEQREDFLQTSRELFKAEQNLFSSNINRLNRVAENRGLNRENVFGSIFFDSIESAEGANLPVGTFIYVNDKPAVVR